MAIRPVPGRAPGRRPAPGAGAPPAAMGLPVVEPPARTVHLPIAAFAPTWWTPKQPKPATPSLEIGILTLSAKDYLDAEKDAAQETIGKIGRPGRSVTDDVWNKRYDDELAARVAAKGTCHPKDRTRPWLDVQSENLPRALQDTGITLLCDAIVDLRADNDPTTAPATDAELAELAQRLLKPEQMGRIEAKMQRGLRRRLARILAAVRMANGPLVKG